MAQLVDFVGMTHGIDIVDDFAVFSGILALFDRIG
jgi:hypothetical protein